MGEYNSETKAWTAFAGTGGASPYTPPFSGRLTGLRAVINRDGASTLMNHVQIKLTCATFKPMSTIEIGAQGSGLQTAPAFATVFQDWDVDQEVQSANPITMEGINITADTPVGVSVLLYGRFEEGR